MQSNRRWLQAGAKNFRLLQNMENDSGTYPVTRYDEQQELFPWSLS